MRWQSWLKLSILPCLFLMVFALLMPAIYQARLAARKSSLKNELKQIGLALHSYHETYGSLPPGGGIREDGTPMNGWLTMIRPFMDASPDYNMLDLNESWDSPRNVYIFERVVPYYLNPNTRVNYTTIGYGLTHYLANPNLFYRNSSVQRDQMQNGTSHTWMSGEVAGNYQPWSYPFNWRFLGTKLCAGPESFGDPDWKGGHLLMADGSVSFFSEETAPKILKRLANAPPLATKEQTEAPSKIFQTGNFVWVDIGSLASDLQSKSHYYAQVLRKGTETGAAFVIRIFTFETIELTEEEKKSEMRMDHTVPYMLLQIDSTTDISRALESTSMFKTVSPEQFQMNVKTLRAIQKQLQ